MPLTHLRRGITLLLFVLTSFSLTGCGATPAPLAPRAIEMNRLGAEALARGELEVAHARIQLALEYHPRFTEAWVNLGLLELERGRYGLAESALLRARDLNRHLPSPHHALGLLAERRSDAYAAKYHYEEALAVEPAFPPSRINLARLLYAANRLEEAREQFLRLTEIAPEVELGWRGLVRTLLRMGRDADADLVIDRIPSSIRELPPLALLHALRAARHGDEAAARALLAPLAGEKTEDHELRAEALAWLALLDLGRRDTASAASELERAAALDPSSEIVSRVKATWAQLR